MKQSFSSLIVANFSFLETEFSFTVEIMPKDEIQYRSPGCIIRFIYDMGSVECDFINPEETKLREKANTSGLPTSPLAYGVYSAWRAIYPNDSIDYRNSSWDLERQISTTQKLLRERLINVIKGDFAWTIPYKERATVLRTKIEYMLDHFEKDNPILIKYKNRDAHWEMEFDEYKRFLDNLQSPAN
jgi:hypothetical protein